jgi:tetratricopeptide (TPR) repeat protein
MADFKKKSIFRPFWCLAFLLVACPAALPAAADKVTVPRAAHQALSKAQGLMEEGDYRAAAEVLNAFRDRKPNWLKRGDRDPEGYLHYLVDFNLANCHLALHRLHEAIIHYELTLSAQPAFTPAWMNLAKACYDAGRYRRAAECFQKAYETADEKQPDTLYYAAVSYGSAEDHSSALAVLLRLLAAHPQAVKTRWREQLVQVYMALERPREALPHLEVLAEATEGTRRRQWQELLFHQYLDLKMTEKALSYGRGLAGAHPTDPRWWRALAGLHLQQNRHREALRNLMVYSYLERTPAEVQRLLGDLSMSVGVPIQASRYYRRLVEESERRGDHLRLIRSCMRRHRPKEALASADTALRYFDDPDIRLLKGEVLYNLEAYDAAIKAFTEVVEQKPDAGRAWLMLGYAAWHTKAYPQAKAALQKALSFPAQKTAADSLLAQLARMGGEE